MKSRVCNIVEFGFLTVAVKIQRCKLIWEMQAFSIDWMKCDHFSLKLIELIVELIDELNGDLKENKLMN